MAYQAFRNHGFPTFYDENKTAWQADILESGLIFAFCIVAASFFIILPGIRGKEKLFTFIRVTLSLYIGAVLVLTNWTYTWETSEIHTRTKYKAGTGAEISADIGVHIGLRGINITLKGSPDVQQLNETINYNEHFGWEWEQGRIGFGPFAGPFNRQYRAAQFRGLPLPILWIAEYFTFDGEGIRWGRHYRQAGWYTHIMLCDVAAARAPIQAFLEFLLPALPRLNDLLRAVGVMFRLHRACSLILDLHSPIRGYIFSKMLSFPLWILTNILFLVVLRYGAIMLIMTGSSMLIGNIIWATLRNVNELSIPWEDGVMEFSFGGSFYVCLLTGIICILLGIVVIVMDLRFPTELDSFFGVDPSLDSEDNPLEEDDDTVNSPNKNTRKDNFETKKIDEREEDGATNGQHAPTSRGAPLIPPAKPTPRQRFQAQEPDEDEELYMEQAAPPTPHRYEKRRSMVRYFQKSRRCRPPPPPPPPIDEGSPELYENEGLFTNDVRLQIS